MPTERWCRGLPGPQGGRPLGQGAAWTPTSLNKSLDTGRPRGLLTEQAGRSRRRAGARLLWQWKGTAAPIPPLPAGRHGHHLESVRALGSTREATARLSCSAHGLRARREAAARHAPTNQLRCCSPSDEAAGRGSQSPLGCCLGVRRSHRLLQQRSHARGPGAVLCSCLLEVELAALRAAVPAGCCTGPFIKQMHCNQREMGASHRTIASPDFHAVSALVCS